MPSKSVHIENAQRFICAYNQLAGSDIVPVQGTILFYSALHLIEAVASLSNVHNQNHAPRAQWVQQNHVKVNHQYRELEKIARWGRYDPERVANINETGLGVTFYNRHYKKIVYWAAEKLNMPELVEQLIGAVAA